MKFCFEIPDDEVRDCGGPNAIASEIVISLQDAFELDNYPRVEIVKSAQNPAQDLLYE